MGKYLQRTSGQNQINLPTSEGSSTGEQDDHVVLQRLKIALSYMIGKGNSLSGKQMTIRVITKIMNEALEDMRDSGMHPDVMALYIRQLSAMTLWIADGKWNSDIPIPDDFGTAIRDKNLAPDEMPEGSL